ncbi:HK97 family phage prohead protease [Nocardioides sp. J54]|uniref:HK97 family phage prohead protease n=1 Tax=Nocardioides sp. J54 TaxID=935866 RepID=UPI00048CCC61|nr:HK97 family phage prohead protease [Nocardioides sp. J54]
MTITDIEVPRSLQEPQFRSAEIREIAADDERSILLRAVPYDVETQLWDNLYESFAPGAFARATKDPARVKFYLGHGGPLVGMAEMVEDREDGVWIRNIVSRTASGDELLTLARDKVLDEASIEFRIVKGGTEITERDGKTYWRHKRAQLLGVALVPHGAYGRNALVKAVRDDQDKAAEVARAAARAEAIARLTGLNH